MTLTNRTWDFVPFDPTKYYKYQKPVKKKMAVMEPNLHSIFRINAYIFDHSVVMRRLNASYAVSYVNVNKINKGAK